MTFDSRMSSRSTAADVSSQEDSIANIVAMLVVFGEVKERIKGKLMKLREVKGQYKNVSEVKDNVKVKVNG